MHKFNFLHKHIILYFKKKCFKYEANLKFRWHWFISIQIRILAKLLQFDRVSLFKRRTVYPHNLVSRIFCRVINFSVTGSMSSFLNRFSIAVWCVMCNTEYSFVYFTLCLAMKSVASCLRSVSFSLMTLTIFKFAMGLVKCLIFPHFCFLNISTSFKLRSSPTQTNSMVHFKYMS